MIGSGESRSFVTCVPTIPSLPVRRSRTSTHDRPVRFVSYGRPIQIGQKLPDLPLVSSRGDEVNLASLRGEATLLIFLRHLG